jgi:hypothetical protein
MEESFWRVRRISKFKKLKHLKLQTKQLIQINPAHLRLWNFKMMKCWNEWWDWCNWIHRDFVVNEEDHIQSR